MKTIYLSGEFGWEITAENFRNQVDMTSKEKLRIILNSNGGYVDEGFEIYNIVKAYKGEVEIIFGVMAASIASYVGMSVPLKNRKGFKNSSFMVHEASRAAYGRARDFLTIAERLEGLNNIVAGAYAEGLGIGKDESREMMREDKYFTGWEALVDANIISDVVDIEDIEIPNKEEDEETYIIFETFMQEMKSEFDINTYKEKMYQIEDKINSDMKKSQDDICRAAAKLKIQSTKESDTGEKPVDDKTNNTGENMNLQEFLKSNPEAKAEYDKTLESAKAEGKESVTVVAPQNEPVNTNAERQRIRDILRATGGVLTEASAKAIEDGISPQEFAYNEMVNQKTNAEKPENKVDFGELLKNQLPGDQDKSGAEEEKKKAEAFDNALEAAQNKRKGGK